MFDDGLSAFGRQLATRGLPSVVLAGLLAACSPVDATQDAPAPPLDQSAPSVHPGSGLDITEVTVVSGEKRIPFKTELALSQQEQARGLMFRETLADDEAMLFPNDPPQMRSFWMKNTPISLDIIFIGVDRRINNIETAVPYSLESVASVGEVIGVFEIRGGLAQELGIKPGDRVEWELP